MTIVNVEFDKDHTVAFNAPVTEILTYKLKEGKAKEDLDAVLVELEAHYARAEGIRQPQTYGPVFELPGTFYSVIGWVSHEVRYWPAHPWDSELTVFRQGGCCSRNDSGTGHQAPHYRRG